MPESITPPNSWSDFNNATNHDASLPLSTDEIKGRLLTRLQEVLHYLFPQGRFGTQYFEIGDINGNPGKSLKVEINSDKAGLWYDFATGEGGNILGLWAACHGLSCQTQFREVIQSAASWLGENITPSTTLTYPPTPPAKQHPINQYTHKWDYLDEAGHLIACVYRYDTSKGKVYKPWDVLARKQAAPNPRPLYNLTDIKNASEVILVEGEKAADSLIAQGITASTAMFGANASLDKTDWTPLRGKHVVIWPDNDKPGYDYAEALSRHLSDARLLLSLHVLNIPSDKPSKWDAADAVNEGINVVDFINNNKQEKSLEKPVFPMHRYKPMLQDPHPMPDDLIQPRVLTPAGLLVLGGAPKVGKSDFLLSLLIHMAAGLPFLGLIPQRPLRIFYLQTEIDYFYLRERIRQLNIDEAHTDIIHANLVITSRCKIRLDENNIDILKNMLRMHFNDQPVDVIAIDPLRNVFDGGQSDANSDENDNNAMLFFLDERIDKLRDTVNPNAGIILAHHIRKIQKKQLQEAPFEALAGASSLRSYYTGGLILFHPDPKQSYRELLFELRNGSKIAPKLIDKIDNTWQELDSNTRLIQKDYGEKCDAERQRRGDIILDIIHEQARLGRLYTASQFAQTFENLAGLGSQHTIRTRLDVLATKGYVKFFKDVDGIHKKAARSKYGFLCVQNMYLHTNDVAPDPDAGEITSTLQPIYPTHYKCKHTGGLLPVENPNVWIDETSEHNPIMQ